jgi:1-deoxy-D-xylulose-5-phosphate reductoisomerase
MPAADVRVTIHPQSTVHSLVEFIDGSILGQISVTDMRLPILYAMTYPDRIDAEQASGLGFDMTKLGQLEFETPDFERFPCLRLAYEAAQLGGAHCIALNAADEIAVEAFLGGDIHFTDIPRTIEAVLEATAESHPRSVEDVLALDEHAREVSRAWLAGVSLIAAGSSKPSGRAK